MRDHPRRVSTGFREREQLSIEAGDAGQHLASGAPEPERSLLAAIAAGELDIHLTAIADAVQARQHLLHMVRSATALAELCVGDGVRINHTVSPQYLRGAYATTCRGRRSDGHGAAPAPDRTLPQRPDPLPGTRAGSGPTSWLNPPSNGPHERCGCSMILGLCEHMPAAIGCAAPARAGAISRRHR